MSRTIVAFHAHPDDEALLTAGTMARAAAAGPSRRAGARDRRRGRAGGRRAAPRRRLGDAAAGGGPAVRGGARGRARRVARLRRQRQRRPSPSRTSPGVTRFSRAPVEEAAERLAAVLRTERADLLLSYDANGGYGHRDHVRVHEVAARAAEIAGTPRVLEATVPRDTIVRAVRAIGRVYRFPAEFDPTLVRAGLLRALRDHPPGRTCAGTSVPSGRRCGPTRRRRPAAARHPSVRAGRPATAPWQPSCASPGPSTISCSGGSGSATPPSRPAGPCAPTSSRGIDELAHPAGPPDGRRAGAGRRAAHLGSAVLRQDVVDRHLERHPRPSRSATPSPSRR